MLNNTGDTRNMYLQLQTRIQEQTDDGLIPKNVNLGIHADR